MKKLISLLIVFVLLIINTLYAQNNNDANSVFDKLKEKYSKIQTVSLKFQSRTNKEIKGSLKAQKGNKYLLDYYSRLIFCDSKSVWNYDKKENKCVVTEYDPESTNSLSLEKFFFEFFDKFKPISVAEETTSKGSKTLMLKLQSEAGNSFANQIKIWIEMKSLTIKSVDFHEQNSTNIFDITELATSTKSIGKKFDFKVPDGAVLIDLR